ncbi:MAG: hypothetical protein HY556_11950 [Euryarchaeota archaeon]|nr:hypothetical protein [Euryarchaeota archaeon]
MMTRPALIAVLFSLSMVASVAAATWTGTSPAGDRIDFDLDHSSVSRDSRIATVRLPESVSIDGSSSAITGALSPVEGDHAAAMTTRSADLTFGVGRGGWTATILKGTRHTDLRLNTVAAGHDIAFETVVTLSIPGAAEIAFGEGAEVESLAFDSFTDEHRPVSSPNMWVALRGADGGYASVVLAGDLRDVTVSRAGNALAVTAGWAGEDAVDAGHYVLLGRASGAAPYDEVMELARMDREELGLAYLGVGVGAGVPWVNGARSIDVAATTTGSDWWEALWGTTRAWTIQVEAPAAQNGKLLRVIVPTELSGELSPKATIDGMPAGLASSSTMEGDGTDSFAVRIPHFSLRTVQIKTVTPGVPPVFMWLTLALGAVVGGESFILARGTLRSRAAARGAAGGSSGGVELRSKAAARGMGPGAGGEGPQTPTSGAARSEAVRRALGETPRGSAPMGETGDTEFKSSLLKKLQEGTGGPPQPGARARYARCNACARPIVFAPGAATVVCPHCQAQNVNSET